MQRDFGLITEFIGHLNKALGWILQLTITHTTCFHLNVFTAVAWRRHPTADLPLPLASPNVPGTSSQQKRPTTTAPRHFF
jgi:hypothetical protein